MPKFEEYKQPEIKKELSPELKERVKEIENIHHGAIPRAEIILVLLGQKPATELDIFKWNDPPDKIMNVLKSVGLSTAKLENIEALNENWLARIVIAKKQEDLAKIEKLDPKKDHAEFGKMMGYPESAIAAFGKKEKILPNENYPSMKGIIFDFKLSKDNWQEEINVLKRWSRVIELVAPDIYKELNVKK